MTTKTTPTTLDDQDPQSCEACVALGGLCAYHLGFGDGWDAASALVGRLVLEQRGE